ncbi:glucokinase [Curtobacterium sp. 'Ferrero']|uniref:ROK family protein n=1 Tax=Curtobacterium sp. 'Ferrero' TaxID=2033654 RepID=UPI000BC8D444|nr:ROK family protein [Curtobacterium sp. 'Ferrero']PCN46702.1 glucokinase [Curtobacterium sp. 'Ferrero']
MSTSDTTVVGIDVGGTNIEVGLVTAEHDVLDRAKASTPETGPDDVLQTIVDLVRSLDGSPVAVGLGIPGVVHEGRALTVPNLVGWTEPVDLTTPLSDAFGVPVSLGNDANVGLLGEWTAGAARGGRNVLGLWMGTGVGGGLVLDGRPYTGSRGAAGEIGHVVVLAGGALCSCGRRGCAEAYAGRASMRGTARTMADAGRETALFDIRDAEEKTKLTSKVWAAALEDDDDLATKLFDTAVDMLGVALGSTINLLDLDRVVVGGGLAETLGQGLADRLRGAADPWMLRPDPELEFVVAELGDDAGVVGAATLARSAVIAP